MKHLRLSSLVLFLAISCIMSQAHAMDIGSFVDGKDKAVDSGKTPPAAQSSEDAKPIISSKKQLASLYKKYRDNFDCTSVSGLADWESVDFWSKEQFSDELCARMYKGIVDISFKPIEPSMLKEKADEKGNIKVYSIAPESIMVVKFDVQKFALSTAPGENPRLELAVAKNKKGSYVFVTTKRKAS